MFAPSLRDWSKVRAFHAGTWPKPLPPAILIEHGLPEVVDEAFAAPFVAIDTEYIPETRRLTMVGVGWPNAEPGGDRVVQITWGPTTPARTAFAAWLYQVVQSVPVVFQNSMADIPVLSAYLGIEYQHYKHVEDTMLSHAVIWSEWPHTLEFLASVYSLYPKTKHLAGHDPLLYNRGDVADTVRCWMGIERELAADQLSAAVYREQSLPLVPILLRRMAQGIKTNQQRISEAVERLEREKAAAERLAWAYCGWPINLGSPPQLQRWLYDVEKLPVQTNKKTKQRTIDDEAMVALREAIDPAPDFEEEERSPLQYEGAIERIEAGAHAMLEARVVYSAAAHAVSHYLRPMLGRDRIFPNYAIHAQASGRWSITGPPLQQFYRAGTELGDLMQATIEPDAGEVWIGWDWKQIEPRLLAYQAGDTPAIKVFESGGDIYNLEAGSMGWPEPTKEQRQFAKRYRLKMSYGGSPKSDTPGASKLGLKKADLAAIGAAYQRNRPALVSYWNRLKAQALTTRQVRSFDGRLRRLLGKTDKAMREALNHPQQGGVSGILNKTMIQIHERLPYALVVITVHDAAWVAVPEDKVDEARPIIREIVTQPWRLRDGVTVSFPADWKERRCG